MLVGINLLREGLDLPEVSLVSILDADKEGFLRSAHVAHPDHRPRGPQRVRPGAHVRRQDHPVDGSRRSRRPTGAARSRSPTTSSTASTRSRCARRSPTSPTCSPARTPTPRSCSAVGPRAVPGQGAGAGRGGRGAAGADIALGAVAAAPVAAGDLADLIQQLTDQMHQAAARAAVRARRPAPRRDRRPEEGAAPDEAQATQVTERPDAVASGASGPAGAEYALAKPGAWAGPAVGGRPRGQGRARRSSASSARRRSGSSAARRAEADEWLAEYPDDASVMAYIGRHGWNTLRVGAAIPDDELREAVDTLLRARRRRAAGAARPATANSASGRRPPSSTGDCGTRGRVKMRRSRRGVSPQRRSSSRTAPRPPGRRPARPARSGGGETSGSGADDLAILGASADRRSAMNVDPWVWVSTIGLATAFLLVDVFVHRPATRTCRRCARPASSWPSTSAPPSLFGLGVWYFARGAVRRRVLRRLAHRVLAVGRQPVHLHHHHGEVRRAARSCQQSALMVGIIIAIVLRGIFIASAPPRSTASAGSSTSSARSSSTPPSSWPGRATSDDDEYEENRFADRGSRPPPGDQGVRTAPS